ncbi:MAG: hypothetical protein LBQ66_00980 [Planctomycetaceae bacterium]|nr:hypothetical protein [Planctomycetaceae bacterium]
MKRKIEKKKKNEYPLAENIKTTPAQSQNQTSKRSILTPLFWILYCCNCADAAGRGQ